MNILVAEDDEPLRLLLTDFLVDLGHEVRTAANGAELVRLAMARKPDLVLTDLQMPEMTGGSMIAMLDMFPGLAGLPVIVLTGATRAELADMGLPREIPVLSKPFDFKEISRQIVRFSGRL